MRKRFLILILMVLWFEIFAEENKAFAKDDNLQTNSIVKMNHNIFGRCKTIFKKGKMPLAFIEFQPEKVWKQVSHNKHSTFMRNMKAKIAKKDILNISFGDPVNFGYRGVAFHFIDFAPQIDSIEYIITDNNNNYVKKHCPIHRKTKAPNKMLYTKEKVILQDDVAENVWNATTVDEVIGLLYGSEAKKQLEKFATSSNVKLGCSAPLAGGVKSKKSLWSEKECLKSLNHIVDIQILSSEKLESVALLYTGNEFPLIFFAKFSSYFRLPLRVMTRFYKDGMLMLIALDNNGKIYHSKSYYLNTHSASDLDDGARIDFHIQ